MSEALSSDSVVVLSAAAAIRARLPLYVDVQQPDLPARLALQSLCHAVDECLDGRCTVIALRVEENRVELRYDAGMPLQPDDNFPRGTIAMELLTALRACHSRKKHMAVGDEFCEIGLAVMNAVCSELAAEIHAGGQQATLHFVAGELVGFSPLQPTREPDSTCLRFTLDAALLPDSRPREADLRPALDALQQRFPTLAIGLDFHAAR